MSDFELAQIYYLAKSQVSTDSTILVSFFFGYLVVAHLAGKQLSTVQVITLTIVYSLIVLTSVATIFEDVLLVNIVGSIFFGNEISLFYSYLTTVIFAICWALTIVYMYQVRKGGDA